MNPLRLFRLALAGVLVFSLAPLASGQPAIPVKILEKKALELKTRADADAYVEALIQLADAYLSVGKVKNALMSLQDAARLQGKIKDDARSRELDRRLGLLYQRVGGLESARSYFTEGIRKAKAANDNRALAILYNDLGSTETGLENWPAAETAFLDAIGYARSAGHGGMSAAAPINLARVYLEQNAVGKIEAQLDAALGAVAAISASDEKIEYALALTDVLSQAQTKFGLAAQRRTQAFELAQQSLRGSGDKRAQSYALGLMGRLYEDENRFEEALQYSRQALFKAQEAGAPESAYRWAWAVGRQLRGMGKNDAAIAAYRQAIDILETIRTQLITGSNKSYRQSVGPLYYQMADLLLKQDNALTDAKQKQENLKAARETLEQVKIAELQDYFQNDCILAQENLQEVDAVSRETRSAIIYPVLLADRTELLVSLPTGLKKFTIPVGLNEITDQARELRFQIERAAGNKDHLLYGRKLYDWLVRPVEPDLARHRIRTLVFVPDGPLRSIPMAVLYDGSRYLIERYALAITPGLKLTNPQPLLRDNMQVLASGITDAVQEFDALPSVGAEMRDIKNTFPTQVQLNKTFLLQPTEKELAAGGYSVVHFATHGEFDADPRKTFLLAYDGKLTLNRLEQTIGMRRYLNEPLELLVLSACKTAAGDDRASLGLAGVAVKAGARSALATLWYINDKATSDLIAVFYRQLKNTSLSKAEALRNAQLSLLQDKKNHFEHPSYWAPFLMIGNWL